ncbi:MAG: GNAT family N-acetyltransferase [Coriobacteriia bacterium]|nr:GNAT family N-acetyltransferase [Coriobacteriia bacterium]
MKIHLATSEDTHSISKIWSECFTDDTNYINNFLDNCFPHTKTFLLTPKNEVNAVASLSVLPCYTNYNGINYPGGYVYAVGTLPEHRGKSYSKYLTEEAFSHARNEKLSFLVVKPATESLYELYSKLSFDTTLYERVTRIYPKRSYNYTSDGLIMCDKNDISMSFTRDPEIEYLHKLREIFLSDKSLLWNKEILSYAIKEISFRNGSVYSFYYSKSPEDQVFYIYYPSEQSDSLVHIIDHNIDNGSTLDDFIDENSSIFPNIKYYQFINLPPIVAKRCSTKKIKSALIKSFEEDPGFNKHLKKLRLSLPME